MNCTDIFGVALFIFVIGFFVFIFMDGMLMTPYHDELGTITSITNNGAYYTYTLQCNGTITIPSVNYYNMSDCLTISLQRTGVAKLPVGNVFIIGVV